MKRLQKKINVALILIINLLFSNCTAWPAIAALLFQPSKGGSGKAFILDDDPIPTVTFIASTSSSGDESSTIRTVALDLSVVSGRTITVAVTDSGGTALSGTDYTAILSLNLRDHDPEKIKVFAKCNLHDLWTIPLVAKEE